MTEPKPSRRKGSASKYVGIGVAVVAVIVILLIFSQNMGTSGSFNIALTEHQENIANGIIGVPAGSYQYYSFNVPSGAQDVRLEGTYTASGGSRNDIRIYVFEHTDFVNWQNGHQVNTYFNSGQLTTGSINTNLPSDTTFYLVYDNTFSTLSSKNVNTKVDLVYMS